MGEDKTEPMVKATSHKKKVHISFNTYHSQTKKKMKIKGKKQIFTFKNSQGFERTEKETSLIFVT